MISYYIYVTIKLVALRFLSPSTSMLSKSECITMLALESRTYPTYPSSSTRPWIPSRRRPSVYVRTFRRVLSRWKTASPDFGGLRNSQGCLYEVQGPHIFHLMVLFLGGDPLRVVVGISRSASDPLRWHWCLFCLAPPFLFAQML